MGHVQRSIFTKAGIERTIHTIRTGLEAIIHCSLLSLYLAKAFNNTISRLIFLLELCKNPSLHPIIPLVEMIYLRGVPKVLIWLLLNGTRCRPGKLYRHRHGVRIAHTPVPSGT
jgi:hypothetical protein